MDREILVLTGFDLEPATLVGVARDDVQVALAPEALERMALSRAVVETHVDEDIPVYGLTTGLGPRVTHRLSREEMTEFSELTVLARSTALGPPLPRDQTRALLLVRLNGLLAGGAGASLEIADALARMLNAGVHPVIPSVGSVGASDLCQMAHLGLALIGQGEMEARDQRLPAREALREADLEPMLLAPKDGLAICNASSATAGRAALVLYDGCDLLDLAQVAAALSMEGFRANTSPISATVAAARPQPGQEYAAAGLRRLLDGGALLDPSAARRLQDPISLRCVSAVHGSLKAALDFLDPILDADLNGSADNPLVLFEEERIVSTGNFHTPALALGLDTLAMALAQVAALSVSRSVALLIERLSGLPGTLSPQGISRSGMAPLLKTGEALLAEVRHLAQPVPHDLRWPADGVEDDITNAPLAARKAGDIVWRLRQILAIELMVAAQAIDLAEPPSLGRGTEVAHDLVRSVVDTLDEDRALAPDVVTLDEELLTSGRLLEAVRQTVD
ncbi:MAG: aromatic amino acid ammonia-lyase [Kiloniellales bacterium]|nr:aromatic amino acid ammonia-lyase [Kiloniellales bacterium]